MNTREASAMGVQIRRANIKSFDIRSIDVTAFEPGSELAHYKITDENIIRKIQASCAAGRPTTCDLGAIGVGRKFYLSLNEQEGFMGSFEVDEDVVRIGGEVLNTPENGLFQLVEEAIAETRS
jgi:hypothetical protein